VLLVLEFLSSDSTGTDADELIDTLVLVLVLVFIWLLFEIFKVSVTSKALWFCEIWLELSVVFDFLSVVFFAEESTKSI
jgi:hypothetical protein